MNKKLLTLAVAAAMVAPTAAMAEAILYGKLHVSIDYQDIEGAQSTPYYLPNGDIAFRTDDFKGWGLNGRGFGRGASRSNRIGVKGSEDLGNGLKAIYQVEFGIQLSEESADGNVASGGNSEAVTMRNSFVGLAGGWGTFVVGRNDTPFKTSTGKLDLFADTMADYNGTVGFEDVRADNAIAYISPSFGGFQLAAAVHAGGGSTAISGGMASTYANYYGAGFEDYDAALADPSRNINADSLAEAYSIAGIYSNGPFYVSLAYESLGNELFMNSFNSVLGDNWLDGTERPEYVEDDYTKWRVGLGLLDWNGFTLTGIYEEESNLPMSQITVGAVEKLKMWQIQAGYAFGNNMVKAMYGSGDRDGRLPDANEANTPEELRDALEGDYYTWAIAFDHNFSQRTKAYVLYTQVDDDAPDSDWSGFSLGMIHSF